MLGGPVAIRTIRQRPEEWIGCQRVIGVLIITAMEATSGGATSATAVVDLLLGGPAHAPALHEGPTTTTYAELRARVAERRRELLVPTRSVVALAGRPSGEWIVSYLAVLAGGHVPLLVGDRRSAIEARWSPAALIEVADGAVRIDHRPDAPAHDLHPDLALLMSTSGSTGSPKLVRLSHQNLVANATAIAASLQLRSDDVAITSLPLHYCYGLSVLHSHLAVGASVVAIDASVVDPCFAAAVARHGVTSLAGVPHTFELLEAAGADRVHATSLRRLTQAGGRMGDEARARWSAHAQRWGADLVVMYGQTEATARMGYLPPNLLDAASPSAVGVAVPGGSFEIRPLPGHDGDDGDVGEIVYRGPNVMLGYATEPADLALGRTVHELATGDLGRIDPSTGLLELVGRRSRFVKPYGLRIALDELERELEADLGTVALTGDDEGVVVAAPGRDRHATSSLVAVRSGLPEHAVAVVEVAELPRTASGKVDHPALLAAARQAPAATVEPHAGADRPSTVLAQVLGRASLPAGTSFVAAGGDSLSYVEASLRLEHLLGSLPDDWQHRPVGELDQLLPGRRRASIDLTVLLRAVGICTVVATHMALVYVPGGAHLLLAVAGYNLSRFQLGLASGRALLGAAGRTIARAAVPAAAVAALVVALTDRYGWTTVALVNNYLGPRTHRHGHWHLWFIEAFVQLVAVTALVLAVPAVRRLDRRWPYLVPLAALGGSLWLRHATWFGIDDPYNLRFRTHAIAWFFVLGWLVHRSTATWQRAATSALILVLVPGTFGRPEREWYIIGGLLLLTWATRVPFPRRAVPVVAALAAASMWILITHFHVWPVADRFLPIGLAYPATLAAGVAVAAGVAAAGRAWTARAPRSERVASGDGLVPRTGVDARV